MKRFLVFIFTFLTSQIIFAQVKVPNEKTQDSNLPDILKNLVVHQDPDIERMLVWHIENNKIKNKIDGYRV